MSKEFDQIKQVINNRKQEQDTAQRNRQLEAERKRAEEERQKKQEEHESMQRSIENKKILESTGIVRLFEEIRDSGIVKSKDEPIYEIVPRYRTIFFGEKVQDGTVSVKIGDYEPARIIWGEECQIVTLAFNISEWSGDKYSYGYYYDDHISFRLTDKKEIEFIGYIDRERQRVSSNTKDSDYTTKIIEMLSEIPDLISMQISKTIN